MCTTRKIRETRNTNSASLADGEMSPAIPLPAALVRFRTHRAFLAVADVHQVIGRHAQLDQEIARRSCPAIAQTQVVFSRAPLVTVAFHVDFGVGEIGENTFQRFRIGRQRGARVFTNIVRVVVIQSILQIGLNPLFQRATARRGRIRGGRRRRGPGNRDRRGSRCVAIRSSGRQDVRNRLRRRNPLRTACGHRSDAVADRHICRPADIPAQNSRLAPLDRRWFSGKLRDSRNAGPRRLRVGSRRSRSRWRWWRNRRFLAASRREGNQKQCAREGRCIPAGRSERRIIVHDYLTPHTGDTFTPSFVN